MSATIKKENEHFPVLLNELISIISPHDGGTFIDCTFGQGGYTKKILQNKNSKVVAIDRDQKSKTFADQLEAKYPNRFSFKNLRFSEIANLEKSINNLKGVIFDLGYSTYQMNDPEKGLSFKNTGELNMKLGLNNYSAKEVINNLSEKELFSIFKFFGEENKSKIISKKIIKSRKEKSLNTRDLVNIINSIKKNPKKKIHNATKVFQALRIFVNEEISELIYGLINSFKLLPIGGIMAVITFHSIEDKIVKYFFKNYSEKKNTSRYIPSSNDKILLFKINKRKPIIPSKTELNKNPSSRSAKLRYAIKLNNSDNFNDLIKKFEYLLDIEKLNKNL